MYLISFAGNREGDFKFFSLISKSHPFKVLKKFQEEGETSITLMSFKKLSEEDIKAFNKVFKNQSKDLEI